MDGQRLEGVHRERHSAGLNLICMFMTLDVHADSCELRFTGHWPGPFDRYLAIIVAIDMPKEAR